MRESVKSRCKLNVCSNLERFGNGPLWHLSCSIQMVYCEFNQYPGRKSGLSEVHWPLKAAGCSNSLWPTDIEVCKVAESSLL